VTLPAPDPPSPPGVSTVPAVAVEDHLERRIRKPADLLRLVTGCAGLAILVGAGLVARATEAGAETDLSQAAHHLTHTLLNLLAIASKFALLVLPVALAVRQFVRGQPRRFGEAAATGAVTVAVVAGLNALLRLPFAAHLAEALTVSSPAHAAALDAYLAAFAAYVTVIDLGGRQNLRAVVWVTVGVYVVTSLVAIQATILSLAIALLLGHTIGVAFRYAAGLPSQRPTALQIAAALSSAGLHVTRMSRITQVWEASRCYAVTTYGGDHLDATVFDRDQEAAGALYRLYRIVRLRNQVAHGLPLSLEHAVDQAALLSYALADAAVATPRLRAAVRVSPEAIVLAHDHPTGTTLAERSQPPTDAQLSRIWDTVLRMHAHDITHRALTADRILLTPAGEVVLLDPSHGDIAASELQRRLDLAQLLAELSLLVGPDRAAAGALDEVGAEKLAGVLPLLQPVALYRTTRQAMRRQHDVLPALRSRLLAEAPDGEVAPVRLERVRPRTVITLIIGVVVAYVLAGQLADIDLASVIRHSQWQWTALALILSALTYVAAALSLNGFVPEHLRFTRTVLAQLAASFVTLVTPAAVGGATLNIRYLQRSGIPPAKATASVGAAQVIAFVLHMLLLVIFAAITGASTIHSLRPPDWVYYVLAGLVVLVLAAMAVPRGRRLLRARLAPALGQVLPRLLDIAHSPRKLAEGLGGALGLTLIYVLCLAACVHALGGSVPITGVAVVYLTGSAIGSAAPTPGGLGAVEVALSAGLTAAGMAGATALSAVLLFRLLTFWLPVPVGWVAFNRLQHEQAL
jgi:glycosyltransferase 2 family protein